MYFNVDQMIEYEKHAGWKDGRYTWNVFKDDKVHGIKDFDIVEYFVNAEFRVLGHMLHFDLRNRYISS